MQDAVELLYTRHVKDCDDKKKKEVNRWSTFAQELKKSLDRYCDPDWHVIVGRAVGYACKKRDKTMAAWYVDNNCTVVIWKSPGIELIPPPETPAPATGAEPAETAAVDVVKVHVVEPATVEAGSEIETVISALNEEALVTSVKDVEAFAQAFRKRLTKELGTIWHVVSGTEFVVEMASERRNYVLATVGKARIVCFQHEQFTHTKVDWQKIFKSVPYLLAVVFCFGYMGLNFICAESYTPTTSAGNRIRGAFCSDNWESYIGMVGAAAIGSLLVFRTLNKVAAAKAAKVAKIA